jgi:hypothetical protein
MGLLQKFFCPPPRRIDYNNPTTLRAEVRTIHEDIDQTTITLYLYAMYPASFTALPGHFPAGLPAPGDEFILVPLTNGVPGA